MSDFFNLNMEGQDILNCLANLSSDEVFTSSKLANEMLDLLPQELFTSPDTKFLDPCCKSGVFLREIAKRLNKGLENWEPDLQKRIDHIFKEQLFAIATTQLTALLSRRSVYCSKYPNSKYSVCKFDNVEGNIRYRRIAHTFKDNKCIYCSATRDKYDRDSSLENYAYEFIHMKNPQEVLNMKFDVVIGNPPYQLKSGGAKAQATPLYNYFVENAIKLQPKYIVMITPSRWFTTGMGLNTYRKEMIHDDRIKIIHDFINAQECFPGVDIKGGVNYFLWDNSYHGKCSINTHKDGKITSSAKRYLFEPGVGDVFIRYNEAISILNKVNKLKEPKMSEFMKSDPFGLPTNFDGYNTTNKGIKIYANHKIGYIDDDTCLSKHKNWVNKWKILTPKAIGSGESQDDEVKPIIAEPNSACTFTYIVFGLYDSKKEAENVCSYIKTKFFHFLLTLKKNTQDALATAYAFIPVQDFSKTWTDEELFKKYDLSEDEIAFINLMIKDFGD